MKRDINETRKRARIYSNENTFCYIKEITPNSRESFYNGFIHKVKDDLLVFFDVVLKKEFPILLESIEVIEPSRKDMDIQTAYSIYMKNKKGVGDGY